MNATHPRLRIGGRVAAMALLATALAACSLPIKPQHAQDTYRINPPVALSTPAIVSAQGKAQAFLVRFGSIEADSGFESVAMMYSPEAQQLRPYRDNRWLAPPAEMLTDAVTQTLIRQPWILGVVPNSAGAPVALNLRCHLNRLEHDVSGDSGRVRLALDCLWLDPKTRSVRAHWYFDESQAVSHNDATQFAQASQSLVDKAIGAIVRQTRNLLATPEAQVEKDADDS